MTSPAPGQRKRGEREASLPRKRGEPSRKFGTVRTSFAGLVSGIYPPKMPWSPPSRQNGGTPLQQGQKRVRKYWRLLFGPRFGRRPARWTPVGDTMRLHPLTRQLRPHGIARRLGALLLILS